MKKKKLKTPEAIEIGLRIMAARESAKMSQSEVAKLCGWLNKDKEPAQNRLSNYESGEREPGFKEIKLLSKNLNRSVCYFYTGDDVVDLGTLSPSIREGVELFLRLDEDSAAKVVDLAAIVGLKR